jgi:hypothetical protein
MLRLLILTKDNVIDLLHEEEMLRLHKEAESYAKEHPTPTVEEELEWAETELLAGTIGLSMWENGYVQAFDSCNVDLDGCCEHGYKSPLILLNIA